MSIHPARIVASLALLAGGFVVGVTILAIVLAQALVTAGASVRPADAALLADLIPLLPFIAGFAIASLAAGLGLLLGLGEPLPQPPDLGLVRAGRPLGGRLRLGRDRLQLRGPRLEVALTRGERLGALGQLTAVGCLLGRLCVE